MRAILIRDPNRMVASAVLSCPKVNEAEVEAFAKMGNVSEDILRTIAMTRAWTKSYGVSLSLVKNSKTPVAIIDEPDAAAHRERREEALDRPERPRAAAARGAEAGDRELAGRLDAAARRLRPLRSHLRQAVHVDGRPLALVFARQRLQQIDRALEILLDGRLGGGVVELLDLGDRVHRRQYY